MLQIYPAIFTKDEDVIAVEFPDLEGCQTYGDDIPHALEMASEALGLYLVALEEDKVSPPAPSAPNSINISGDDFVSLVSTDLKKYRRNKSVNTTVTLPLWLKEAAETQHINFSGVLQEALQQRLNTH